VLAAFGTVSFAWAAQAASVQAPIQVEFLHPEQFNDAADRNPADAKRRDFYLGQLARYLSERAAPMLRAGQHLNVVISEVNRAGAFEPWRRALDDVRIVRNVYPVRISLRFRLEGENGALLQEGERELRDSFFLDRWHRPNDPLRYEKALLDDWLERELGNRPASFAASKPIIRPDLRSRSGPPSPRFSQALDQLAPMKSRLPSSTPLWRRMS
jgi:hypothetical protein